MDDLLQDIFVKVHKRLSTLRGSEGMEAWLFQITRHTIIDYYRARHSAEPLTEDFVAETVDLPNEDRLLLFQAFREMIDALPEPYATAIRLTVYEGVT